MNYRGDKGLKYNRVIRELKNTPLTSLTKLILLPLTILTSLKPHLTQRGFIKLTKSALVSYLIISTVIVGSGLIYLFNPLGTKEAEAAWFNDNWGYRQAITVTVTSSASDITYLDTLLTVDTTGITAKVQSACQDLRFTDMNGNILTYFIDTCSNNSATNKIWVRINLVPKNTTTYTVYMYYGNPAATAGTDPVTMSLYKNLAGYWTLNGSSGNAVDSSVNGTTLTNDNGVPFVSGQYGNAADFEADNGNDRFSVTDNAPVSTGDIDFTVTAWFKPESIPTAGLYPGIVSKWGASGQEYAMDINGDDGQAGFAVMSSGDVQTNVESTTPLSTGTWYFAVGWHDSVKDTINFQLNNGTIFTTPHTTGVRDGTNIFKIGSLNDGSHFFDGLIDDVRLYKRVLSAEERTKLYTNPGSITTTATATSNPSTSYASEEKAPTAIAYWKFDEGTDNTCSGGTNDACNSGNAGKNADGAESNMSSPPTATSGWQTEDQCISGKCLAFDKANDVVNAGSAAVLDDIATTSGQDLTVEAWIKPVSTGEGGANGGVIIGKFTGPTNTIANGWVLAMTTGNAIGFSADGSTDLLRVTNTTAGNAVTLNTWNHVTVTWDGSTTAANVHIYINGIEATYATSTDGVSLTSDAATNLLIGNDSTGANTFDGKIDEPKIYNYVRSSAQIQADYNSRSNPQGLAVQNGNNTQNMPAALSNGLVGYWKMDESSGNTSDSSGNGLTLTNTNSVSYAAGKFGNSGSFTQASSKYFVSANTTAPNVSSGGVTIAAWVNTTAAGGFNDQSILQKGTDSNSANYDLNIRDQSGLFPQFIFNDGATNYKWTASTAITSAIWTHVLVTYTFGNSSSIKIYVNGQSVSGSWDIDPGTANPTTGNTPITVGNGFGFLTARLMKPGFITVPSPPLKSPNSITGPLDLWNISNLMKDQAPVSRIFQGMAIIAPLFPEHLS